MRLEAAFRKRAKFYFTGVSVRVKHRKRSVP